MLFSNQSLSRNNSTVGIHHGLPELLRIYASGDIAVWLMIGSLIVKKNVCAATRCWECIHKHISLDKRTYYW